MEADLVLWVTWLSGVLSFLKPYEYTFETNIPISVVETRGVEAHSCIRQGVENTISSSERARHIPHSNYHKLYTDMQ